MTSSDSTLDPIDFRNAMSRFASGVTIVATITDSGERWGFTASAFSSLSLDPPLILVCLDRRADCFEAFAEAEAFGVSILEAGQSAAAMTFATRGADKFAGVATSPGRVTGQPLVEGALSHIECRMNARLDGGDHVILLGEVVSASVSEVEPLLHYNRNFGQFVAG